MAFLNSLAEASVLAKKSTPEVCLSNLWTFFRLAMPFSLSNIPVTELSLKFPQGWTGMEGGLSTAKRSSFSYIISIGVLKTGVSYLVLL